MTEPPGPRELHAVRRLVSSKYVAKYDSESIDAFLDSHCLAHVGFLDSPHEGWPTVIPMLYGRSGGSLYVHGYVSGRLVKALRGGGEAARACVTVTQLDGIVCATSLYNSSINYQSACVYGTAELVEGREAKLEALKALSESVHRGRWGDARVPNDSELRSTGVIRIPIDKASLKMRTGMPDEGEEDLSDAGHMASCWAGVLPVRTVYGEPRQAGYSVTAGAALPRHLAEQVEGNGGLGAAPPAEGAAAAAGAAAAGDV